MRRYYKLEANSNILYFASLNSISKILLTKGLNRHNNEFTHISEETLKKKLNNEQNFGAALSVNADLIQVDCFITEVGYPEYNRNRAAGGLFSKLHYIDKYKYKKYQIFPYLQKRQKLSNGLESLNSPDFDLIEQKGIEKNITILSLFALPAESDLIFIKTVDLIKLNHMVGVELTDAKLKMYQQNGKMLELFIGTDLLKAYIQDKTEVGICRFTYSGYKKNSMDVKYWLT